MTIQNNSYNDNLIHLKKYRLESDEKALDWLLNKNQLLVYKLANKYRFYYNHKLDFEDLVSAGMEGLLKAIERFDLKVTTTFSTYATYWIKQAITRQIFTEGFTIRIPVHMFEKLMQLKVHERKAELNNLDIESEVCNKMGISSEVYNDLKTIEAQLLLPASTNSIVSKEDNTTELQDILVQNEDIEKLNNPEAQLLANDKKEYIDTLLEALPSREQKVIIERFGLYGKKVKTLELIGQEHGLSRERVRQIENKALRRLKLIALRHKRVS